MQEKSWISSLLDYLGLVSLITAVAALAGIVWFGGLVPESILFNSFHGSLALAVSSFLISRVADIAKVISQTPDPTAQRAAQAMDSVDAVPAEIAGDAAVIGRDKFPRAA